MSVEKKPPKPSSPGSVAVLEQFATPAVSPITPMTMLAMAVNQGADIEKLEKLMVLQERWEANEARKAYCTAMSDFRNEQIVIDKDAHVSYSSNKGTVEYDHASLGNVSMILGSALAKHGLSFRWNTEQIDGRIKVTCIVMHNLGHSESVSLEAAKDDSGGKNSIQAVGSTVSYLQRYTLLAITGTATMNQDDDGASSTRAETTFQHPDAKAAPEFCPDEVFVLLSADTEVDGKKKRGLRTLIESGAKPVEVLISQVDSKYTLSDAQKEIMRAWAPVVAPKKEAE